MSKIMEVAIGVLVVLIGMLGYRYGIDFDDDQLAELTKTYCAPDAGSLGLPDPVAACAGR